ncbi:MAG: hypothetical protein F7B59_03230 [Desulfurococcales archaeon]|nr:hypothetical protein [Desulfurococcales archaeon]
MGVSVAFSAIIIVIALLVALALVLSAVTYNIDKLAESLKEIPSYSKISTLVRIVNASIYNVSPDGRVNLSITVNNYGSTRIWDFNHSQIIVDIVNNSRTLDSYLLKYRDNWSISNISNDGTVTPYSEGEPVYPGENMTIIAALKVPSSLYTSINGSAKLLFNEMDLIFIYANGARGEYRVMVNG